MVYDITVTILYNMSMVKRTQMTVNDESRRRAFVFTITKGIIQKRIVPKNRDGLRVNII